MNRDEAFAGRVIDMATALRGLHKHVTTTKELVKLAQVVQIDNKAVQTPEGIAGCDVTGHIYRCKAKGHVFAFFDEQAADKAAGCPNCRESQGYGETASAYMQAMGLRVRECDHPQQMVTRHSSTEGTCGCGTKVVWAEGGYLGGYKWMAAAKLCDHPPFSVIERFTRVFGPVLKDYTGRCECGTIVKYLLDEQRWVARDA